MLLVDNNISITRYLTIRLEDSGYDVSVVHSLGEVQELAGRLKPNIVVLSSHLVNEKQEAASRLTERLCCPIVIYRLSSAFSPEEEHYLTWYGNSCRVYEPEELIRQIKTVMTRRECRNDLNISRPQDLSRELPLL